MGISCDFEVNSMESEIKPTCNKELFKANGQDVCNDVESANTAVAESDEIDGQRATGTVVNLVSPPQEVRFRFEIRFIAITTARAFRRPRPS